MAIQHLTTAEIKAANLRAIENGTLAAIRLADDNASRCSYILGCAVGCAMTPETIARIQQLDAGGGCVDGSPVRRLVEEFNILEIEDIAAADRLQQAHDRLAGHGLVDYHMADIVPAIAPYVGQPITVDLYRLAVEAL